MDAGWLLVCGVDEVVGGGCVIIETEGIPFDITWAFWSKSVSSSRSESKSSSSDSKIAEDDDDEDEGNDDDEEVDSWVSFTNFVFCIVSAVGSELNSGNS